jgi:RNA recognition motif-containing protein
MSAAKKDPPQSNELKLLMQAKSASQAVERKHQVRVSGLTWAADEAMLREMFEDVGNITHIAVPKDKVSGHCRGFAFVSFTDAAGMRAAIDNFNDQDVEDMHLRVERAEQRESEAPVLGLSFERTKEHAMREAKERHERRKNAKKQHAAPY